MRPKVIQWATGRVGSACVRAIHEHPAMDLVAVASYDPAKIGRDAGDVVGIGRIGVPVVSVKDTPALEADCVVHTPRGEMHRDQAVAEICALLETGKDVCSTAMMALCHPRTSTPEHRARIAAACEAGQSTFHATGINPGFFADLVTAFLSGVCANVRRVHSTEIYDYENHSSHTTVVEFLKYGRPLAEAAEMPKDINVRSAPPAMHVLADIMGVTLDGISGRREMYAAKEDFEIRTTPIRKGTVAGRRETYVATVGGVEAITFEYVHRANPRVAPEWAAPSESGPHRFVNRLYGTPNVVSTIELGHDDPEHLSGAVTTGMRAVNAVLPVIASRPGHVTMADLPMLVAPFRPS